VKKKILFITTSRADYGQCKNLLLHLQSCKKIKFNLIVSGTHLLESYGKTINEIYNDKITVSKKINIFESINKRNVTNDIDISNAAFNKFKNIFKKMNPDYLIIFGDRFEMLPIAYLAYLNRTKIIHINGGEVTMGAIDESIRHSITKLSDYHFVSNDLNKKRIMAMGENKKNIYNFGSLGVDTVNKLIFFSKSKVEKDLKIKLGKKNLVLTFHPETYFKKNISKTLKKILNEIKKLSDIKLFITAPNFDSGSENIRKVLLDFCKKNKNFYFIKSLGIKYYISLVNLSDGVIGNSSSGIIEVPTLKKGTINIGDRQKGRSRSKSIIDCKLDVKEILYSIKKLYSLNFQKKLKLTKNVYEKKNSSKKIFNQILEITRIKEYKYKEFFIYD
tara:strand:+ start:2471 stop:3637 length:1167 start_codon:yes stop_codon:yes gene_type:complete